MKSKLDVEIHELVDQINVLENLLAAKQAERQAERELRYIKAAKNKEITDKNVLFSLTRTVAEWKIYGREPKPTESAVGFKYHSGESVWLGQDTQLIQASPA